MQEDTARQRQGQTTSGAAEAQQIARVVYEALRAYGETLGQAVQPPWNETPERVRASSIIVVERILAGNPLPTEGTANHESRTRDAITLNLVKAFTFQTVAA
jgi:hypothetical protein